MTVSNNLNSITYARVGWSAAFDMLYGCLNMTWHMRESGVRATCGRRATEVIKTSVYEYKLGVGFIWLQVKHSGTYGELEGTWRHVMEWYVLAREAKNDECGLGCFQRVTSGAFPNVLVWSWHFVYVNWLLWTIYEVLVKLPDGVLGICWRCCSMHRGGS